MKKKSLVCTRAPNITNQKYKTFNETFDETAIQTVDSSSCYCTEGEGEKCWSCRLRRLILIQDASVPSSLIQSL